MSRGMRTGGWKKFPGRDSMKPKDAIARLGTFADAQSEEDAIYSAQRINARVQRERVEARTKARDAYLASLLPRGDASAMAVPLVRIVAVRSGMGWRYSVRPEGRGSVISYRLSAARATARLYSHRVIEIGPPAAFDGRGRQ